LDSQILSYARPIVERAASSTKSVELATILPPEAYISETFWAFERQAIFEKEWLCVGHINEIPNAGDIMPTTVLDEPVLMVRGQDNIVRVLSSVCQHRGHPMVGGVAPLDPDKPCFNRSRLVCPYHNWTYGLDGSLIGAPSMDDTWPPKEMRKSVRLHEYRTEIFHGLVFINFSPDAPPLRQGLDKLAKELATYPLQDLVPSHILKLPNLQWNWKLHHENALEPYHTDYVHKGFHASVPAHLTHFCKYEAGDGQIMRWTGFAKDGGDLFHDGGRKLPEIEGLTNEQRHRVMFVSLMPTVILVMQPASVVLSVINVRSAGVMEMRRVTLFTKAATTHADYKHITDENFKRLKIILSQDAVTQEALQATYHSRFMPDGRLAWLESAIPQLNAWVFERYQSALRAPAA
jgi:phenylpropionate dioxygenase-like ring-hydroxylating dioxygenase large terminal subunit